MPLVRTHIVEGAAATRLGSQNYPPPGLLASMGSDLNLDPAHDPQRLVPPPA
jgi:hypothetical protein